MVDVVGSIVVVMVGSGVVEVDSVGVVLEVGMTVVVVVVCWHESQRSGQISNKLNPLK